MAGFVSNDVMDVMLQYVKDNGDTINLCSTLPTTFIEATSTYMLAQGALTNADYTLADGDVSGRKVTLAAQSGLVVSVQGTTAYAAITDSIGSDLLICIPCGALLLYVGNTANTTASDWEIQDVA
jgi:hypothetical protein